MIRVNIADLKPGMVLAHSVRNHQGAMLLGAGAKITKKNIRIFKSWGVIDVSVAGPLDELRVAGEMHGTEANEAAKMELKEKFSDVIDDTVMAEIFNAASKLLMKDLPKNKNAKKNTRP
jgi:hypothetical protein